jgi:tetratricopeptide (TPR) repeat protein
MVAEKMNNKDYQEAIKFLNLVIRSNKGDPQRFSTNLAIAYLDLANCYKAIGDEDNEKKLLIDAAKLNLAVPVIYLSLYDIYLKENDTIKCGEILTQARKVLPDSLATNVKSYELDYFSMIGDTAKLKNAAMKMYEEFKTEPKVINIIVGHLINIKEYTIAEDMINAGLLIDPNSFELLQQMAYRFYREAYDFEDIKTAKLAERPRKYIEAEAALNKSREIFGTAVIWAEKAYSFNQDDKEHNIIYRQMLVILELPVPDDLNEKVNSYIKQ